MKVIGFTNWLNENYAEIDDFDPAFNLAWDVTVQYMRRHRFKYTGTEHQEGTFGTPVFDTNQKLCLSCRAWGALMAEVLELPKDEENGHDMSYCCWAWDTPDEQIFPPAHLHKST